MAAPTIYRSTDANAPVLFGGGGSLITLLDACLVNGYGSAFATGTLTHDTVAPADGDTVTIGSQTYTFKTAIGSTPNNVLIGGTNLATLQNLQQAINGNGTVGTTYPTGTLPSPEAWCPTVAYPVMTITARKGGTAGNSIALARASAGTPHFAVSGATLTGGSGTDSKASLGWTKPIVGTNWQWVAYKEPAGCGFYLQLDDSGPGTGGARDGRGNGYETLAAFASGTGPFPTSAQAANGVAIRKSTSLDTVARAWTLIGDDRTFYLFTYSGDTAGNAHGFSFGDVYSLLTGEAYKCLIMGGTTESASAVTTSIFGQLGQFSAVTSMTGHWLPRNFAGVGGSTAFVKMGDYGASGGAGGAVAAAGVVGFPNPSDGGLYLAPIRIIDGATPGATTSGTLDMRGRLRGLYQVCHAVASFADGDTFSGAGDYAGRNFMIIKIVGSAMYAVETTTWDISA